jgi:hypothetical protein
VRARFAAVSSQLNAFVQHVSGSESIPIAVSSQLNAFVQHISGSESLPIAVSSQLNAFVQHISGSESIPIERNEVNVMFLINVNSCPLKTGERNQGKMDSECRVFNRVWEEQYSLSNVGTITVYLCMHGCQASFHFRK